MYEKLDVGGYFGLLDGVKYRYVILSKMGSIEVYTASILYFVAVDRNKLGGDDGSGTVLPGVSFEGASDGNLGVEEPGEGDTLGIPKGI